MQNWVKAHMNREGNMATHGLDRCAQFVDDFVTWMEEIPPIIEIEVTPDVNRFFSVSNWNKATSFWLQNVCVYV